MRNTPVAVLEDFVKSFDMSEAVAPLVAPRKGAEGVRCHQTLMK